MCHDISNYHVYSAKNWHCFNSHRPPLDSLRELLSDGCRCLHLQIKYVDEQMQFDLGDDYSGTCLLSDLLLTLSENAFTHSPYPVILFLSFSHAFVEYDTLFELFNSHFGPAIYIPDIHRLSSPELLVERFILAANVQRYKISDSQLFDIILPVVDNYAAGTPAMECAYKDISRKMKFKENTILFTFPSLKCIKNPIKVVSDAWKRGVQFAMFDFKAMGDSDYYSSFFHKQGYVLKQPPGSGQSKKLNLTIISALDLPIPQSNNLASSTVDPYCAVDLRDFGGQDIRVLTNSRLNTNNPIFMESFSCFVDSPDFAQLKLSIFDADYISKSFIGQCIVPVRRLQSGFQWLPIFNSGVQLDASKIYIYARIDHQLQKNEKFKKIVKKLKAVNSFDMSKMKRPLDSEDMVSVIRDYTKEISSTSLCVSCVSTFVDVLDSLIDCSDPVEPIKFSINWNLNHRNKCSEIKNFFDNFIPKFTVFVQRSGICVKQAKNITSLTKRFSFRYSSKQASEKGNEWDLRTLLNNELKYMRYWLLTIEEINK